MSQTERDALEARIDEFRRSRRRQSTAEEAEAIRIWQQQGLKENARALEDWNRWIADNGLPLAKYRQF